MSTTRMNAAQMINALRGVAPGATILVTYDTAPRATPRSGTIAKKRTEKSMENAYKVGLPSNVYVGRFASLFATDNGDVLLSMFVFNRGEEGTEGEPRAFNPSRGDLRGIFVLPREAKKSARTA